MSETSIGHHLWSSGAKRGLNKHGRHPDFSRLGKGHPMPNSLNTLGTPTGPEPPHNSDASMGHPVPHGLRCGQPSRCARRVVEQNKLRTPPVTLSIHPTHCVRLCEARSVVTARPIHSPLIIIPSTTHRQPIPGNPFHTTPLFPPHPHPTHQPHPTTRPPTTTVTPK